MAENDLPSPDELRQLLRYEPDTGKLFWKERPQSMFSETKGRSAQHACANWNSRYAGSEAFTATDSKGYRVGSISKRLYRAHRVIWAIVEGGWPAEEIDHVNGSRFDNRFENLRQVTATENRRNQRRPKDNTSGAIGVGWHAQRGKWRAFITVGRKMQHLGLFDSFDLAVAARKEAERARGFHPTHGRV